VAHGAAEMLEAFWGKQFNPEGLDAKTRLLLTLQGLTIQGAVAEAQIRLTVRHAIEAGATKQEVAEAIGMAAMFGGVPAMNKAMELAKDAIDGAEE
jgi:4-carboxymuconolactone decarboxylase